jgi:transcriptional regulator with XRE-family HTH domain
MGQLNDLGLGKKLAVLAKLRGKTQEEIAKECKMSRISVNRFFRQHTEIRAGDLSQLLQTLGINLESLIDRAIERQMNGSQSVEEAGPLSLASSHLNNDQSTKTILQQIQYWSQQLGEQESELSSERLMAAAK